MKKNSIILTLGFLMIIGFFGQQVLAQESTAAQKEKEQKLKEAIELQKKAMEEEKKAQERQVKELQSLRDTLRGRYRENFDPAFYRQRVRSSGNPMEGVDEIMGMPLNPGGNVFSNYYIRGGDSERTTWDYSKQVKESTYSNDLSFEVEKSAKNVSMSLRGECKSGQVRIKITMPSGKVYSDVVIDESGNLNWRKSFTISEEQNKDKTGVWKFKVEAEKATGNFNISFQTF